MKSMYEDSLEEIEKYEGREGVEGKKGPAAVLFSG